nr:unnamed protein product [Digitaria exilis]
MDSLTKLVSQRAVVIFDMSSGDKCHAATDMFRNLGVSPTVVELDKDTRGKEMEKALVRLTGRNPAVPVVFIGGRLVGSIDTVMSLHLRGTLVPMLRRIGAILERYEIDMGCRSVGQEDTDTDTDVLADPATPAKPRRFRLHALVLKFQLGKQTNETTQTMMPTRALRLLAVAALLVVVAVATVPTTPFTAGGWSPIKDVSDPYIQELGAWAVSEYLKQGHVGGLQYGQVLSGEQQVVSGMNYKLVLDAMDTTATTANKYKAFVFDQWTKTRELKSFEPAD